MDLAAELMELFPGQLEGSLSHWIYFFFSRPGALGAAAAVISNLDGFSKATFWKLQSEFGCITRRTLTNNAEWKKVSKNYTVQYPFYNMDKRIMVTNEVWFFLNPVIWLFCFVLFAFLGLHMQHMFPGQGSNWSCGCWPTPQPQQHRIWAVFATYITAHGNVGSLTRWVGPGIKPLSSGL